MLYPAVLTVDAYDLCRFWRLENTIMRKARAGTRTIGCEPGFHGSNIRFETAAGTHILDILKEVTTLRKTPKSKPATAKLAQSKRGTICGRVRSLRLSSPHNSRVALRFRRRDASRIRIGKDCRWACCIPPILEPGA
jgi:hypothetical protein